MVLSKPQKNHPGGGGLFPIGLWKQVGCLPGYSDCDGAASASGQENN